MSTKDLTIMARIFKKFSNDSLKCNQLTTAAVTLVFSLVFFPVFLCTLLIWLPIRLLIVAFARGAHPNLELVETGIGTLIELRSASGRPDGNLVYHLKCQGDFSLDELRNQFTLKVLEYTDPKGQNIYRHLRYFFHPFFQVLCWKEDLQFDLKNHIRFYDFNEPELALPEDSVTEDDLMRVTGPLVARRYAPEKSPWELLLIKNFKGKSGENLTVITLRIHHGLTDGLSCIGLIHRLFGAPPPPSLAQFAQLAHKDRIIRALAAIVRAPYELARLALLFNDGLDARKLPRTKRTDSVVSFCSDPIPWSQVKRIMTKFDVNSNAAIYSIIAGALVRLMKQAGQQIPSKLSVLTSYPIPNHPGGLCNHFSFGFFGFNPHTHIGPSLVVEVGSHVKAAHCFNPLAAVMDGMANLQSLLPNFIARRFAARSPPTSFTFSQFPGPLRELYDPNFATLVDIIPAVDLTGLGSAIAVSTAGNLRIGLTVNKELIQRQGEDFSRRLFAMNIAEELQTFL